MANRMITLEAINARLKKYVENFALSRDAMEKIVQSFQDELKVGLQCHMENPHEWDPIACSLKMLDSCVPDVVKRETSGVYYALDFGGTFVRAVRVKLKGNGTIETDSSSYSLQKCEDPFYPNGLMDASVPGYVLFDRFAKEIHEMMVKHGDIDNGQVVVGFTFSFPCMQKALRDSSLVVWTKEFETGRNTDSKVEGQNVGTLLDEAFVRNGVPARVGAILNDTVGTLLSCAYQKTELSHDCMIGLIIGTGSNACYVEPNWSNYNYQGIIVNTEFGNFNKELPLTDIDIEIDWNSSNKGSQVFEKLISGQYVGEIARIAVIRVLQAAAPAGAWVESSLTSTDVANIINDHDAQLKETSSIISKCWLEDFSLEHLQVIQKICAAVLGRSARLIGCAIAGIAQHIQLVDSGLTCGIDGSLYVKNKWYRDQVKEALTVLLADKAKNINLEMADDGSGKGAALIAAVS